MVKRSILIIFCLAMVLSIGVAATNTQNPDVPGNGQTTEEFPQRPERQPGGGRGNMGAPPDMQNGEFPGSGNTPPRMGDSRGEMQPEEVTSANPILTFIKTYSTPITSIVLLLFAFVFVVFYKRKKY